MTINTIDLATAGTYVGNRIQSGISEPFVLSMCGLTEPTNIVAGGETTSFVDSGTTVTYTINLDMFSMTAADAGLSAVACPAITVSMDSGSLVVTFAPDY